MLITNTLATLGSYLSFASRAVKQWGGVAFTVALLCGGMVASASAVDGKRANESTGSMNIGLVIPADRGIYATPQVGELATQDSLKSSSPFCIFGVDQKQLDIRASNAQGETVSVEYLRPNVAENGDCTAKKPGLLTLSGERGNIVMLTIGVN